MASPDFPTSIVTSRRFIPNVQPIAEPYPYRIAIIGEAPGEVEENCLVPFSGPSGSLLGGLLRDVGIDRHRCFVGNICQVRPPNNDITKFAWQGKEIQSGLAQLKNDLDQFQPNICILLGNAALRAARGQPAKISDWCSSLFIATGPELKGYKCIPGFHPANILRFWGMDGNFPRLKACLQRAKGEAESLVLHLPNRDLLTDFDAQTLCRIMDEWPAGQRCSVDIEGGLPNNAVNDGVRADSKKRRYIGWRCVAISARPSKGIAIAWWKFNEFEHALLLQSFARLMARTDVPKVLQNSLYDNFVLAYGYGIPIRNVVEDTMLKGWECYPELPKSLGVQASIYTREPHWKDEEMYETTGEALARGCCIDVAVTLEICQAQDGALSSSQKAHYHKNIEMLWPALYMQIRGINYDTDNVRKRKLEVKAELETCGESCNAFGGRELRGAKGSLSSKRLAECLYQPIPAGGLGYEPQFKKENGRRTTKWTTDVEAILTLKKKNSDDKFLSNILRHRHLEGLLETLGISADSDGRVRCSYNVVGAETGRFSCKTSPTGSGANLTTIMQLLRGNYTADLDYDFFQYDLEGADGWTVAAHCLRLGDSTMWDDYKFGIKPAKVIALLYLFGSVVNQMDRDSIKFWTTGPGWKSVLAEVGDWIYLGCKKVQHGTNYLMGIPTMIKSIMIESFKDSGTPIYLDQHLASELQGHYFSRYPGIRFWHSWAKSTLVATGQLTSASGSTRTFFGRRFGKDIHDTVKEFLSHEPQSNTTWATNLAMLNLWNDPSNRVSKIVNFNVHTCDGSVHYWAGSLASLSRITSGALLIEPLHQVHDALCGQWPSFLRDWARAKVRSYFENELTIAGTKLTIPFDGGWGKSWGDCKNPL